MDIKPALSSGLSGVQRGLQDLDRNAFEVAQAAAGEEKDVTRPLVESQLNRHQVEASAKVVSAVDQALGTLLDEKA